MGTLNTLVATALLSSAGSALALRQAPEREEHDPPVLVASGQAEVAVPPDRAWLGLGASAQAATAQGAQEQVNGAMQRTIAALREWGVPEVDMQTSGLSLYPVYSDARPQSPGESPEEPRIVGWRASNSLRIQVADPAAVGQTIDVGIGAGANELQDVSFDLRDDTAQRAEALRGAVRNARTKAEALADAAGVELVELVRIEEGGAAGEEPRFARAMAFESSAPVQPGRVRVGASVTLVYRIAPREGKDPRDR